MSSSSLPSIESILQADTLPSPPAVAVEILRLTREEGVGIDDLSQVISLDPALCAKIMKLANSSLFARGEEVRSIDQAMMRLGLKTVKLMALSFSLVRIDVGSGAAGFDYGQFWQRVVVRAVAARSLAHQLGFPVSEEAFLCGILSRIGQLALNETSPEAYQQAIDNTPERFPSLTDEQAIFGYDHAMVGGALLEKWELPGAICKSVLHASDPLGLDESASDDTLQLTTVVNIAKDIETVLFDQAKGEAMQTLSEKLELSLGLEPEEAQDFLLAMEADIQETAKTLDIAMDSVADHANIVEQARMQMVQVSLGAAVDLQVSESKNAQLEKDNQELERISVTDKMTGINNRAFFDRQMQEEVETNAAGDGRRSLGLLVLDVDKFKLFNDTHGHVVGDEVLKAVARVMQDQTPDEYYPARYGGEEFVVIMPEADETELERVAESIRKAIESTEVETQGKVLKVTISVGGAVAKGVNTEAQAEALLKAADGFLYEAKEGGRNRSCCRRVDEVLA